LRSDAPIWVVGLDNRWLPGGDEIALLRNVVVGGGLNKIEIPTIQIEEELWGFTMDGGTSPPISWPVIGHPFGRYLPAYGGHDYRWAFRNLFPGMSFTDSNDALYADVVYYGTLWQQQGMKINPKRDAWLHYQAVQRFGKRLWDKKNHVGDVEYHYTRIE